MGGVLGHLVCLFCKSGCRGSAVASALAFHPPDSMYDIHENKSTGEYSIELCNTLPRSKFKGVEVDVVTTKSKTAVPVLLFRIPDAKYTILYSHGNATDCGAMYAYYVHLAQSLGVNVVGYDYTGYGPYDGLPNERQTYKDIEAVYAWVCERVCPKPSEQLILYGQSVGSGPSCYLASRQPTAGLVLHSPILSGVRVLTSSRLLACCDIFPNIDRIKRVRCPVLIIHGLEDEEVPVGHGRGLYEAVPVQYKRDPWWVAQRGHNNVLDGNEVEYITRLATFLGQLKPLEKT